VTSPDLLSKYLITMELRFDLMLCSTFGSAKSDAARGPPSLHKANHANQTSSDGTHGRPIVAERSLFGGEVAGHSRL